MRCSRPKWYWSSKVEICNKLVPQSFRPSCSMVFIVKTMSKSLVRRSCTTAVDTASSVWLVRPRRVLVPVMSGVVSPWRRRQLRRRSGARLTAQRRHADVVAAAAARQWTLSAAITRRLASMEQVTKAGTQRLRSGIVCATRDISVWQNTNHQPIRRTEEVK